MTDNVLLICGVKQDYDAYKSNLEISNPKRMLPPNVFAQAVAAEPNQNDINLPDIIPEDNEILSGHFTVYA